MMGLFRIALKLPQIVVLPHIAKNFPKSLATLDKCTYGADSNDPMYIWLHDVMYRINEDTAEVKVAILNLIIDIQKNYYKPEQFTAQKEILIRNYLKVLNSQDREEANVFVESIFYYAQNVSWFSAGNKRTDSIKNIIEELKEPRRDESITFYTYNSLLYTFRLHSDGPRDEEEKLHGKGKEYHNNDGSIRYNGDFINGIKTGQGTLYYPNIETPAYIGGFLNNQLHSPTKDVILCYSNNTPFFKGRFDKGMFSGKNTTLTIARSQVELWDINQGSYNLDWENGEGFNIISGALIITEKQSKQLIYDLSTLSNLTSVYAVSNEDSNIKGAGIYPIGNKRKPNNSTDTLTDKDL